MAKKPFTLNDIAELARRQSAPASQALMQRVTPQLQKVVRAERAAFASIAGQNEANMAGAPAPRVFLPSKGAPQAQCSTRTACRGQYPVALSFAPDVKIESRKREFANDVPGTLAALSVALRAMSKTLLNGTSELDTADFSASQTAAGSSSIKPATTERFAYSPIIAVSISNPTEGAPLNVTSQIQFGNNGSVSTEATGAVTNPDTMIFNIVADPGAGRGSIGPYVGAILCHGLNDGDCVKIKPALIASSAESYATVALLLTALTQKGPLAARSMRLYVTTSGTFPTASSITFTLLPPGAQFHDEIVHEFERQAV